MASINLSVDMAARLGLPEAEDAVAANPEVGATSGGRQRSGFCASIKLNGMLHVMLERALASWLHIIVGGWIGRWMEARKGERRRVYEKCGVRRGQTREIRMSVFQVIPGGQARLRLGATRLVWHWRIAREVCR
jgi:hypothetical protein